MVANLTCQEVIFLGGNMIGCSGVSDPTYVLTFDTLTRIVIIRSNTNLIFNNSCSIFYHLRFILTFFSNFFQGEKCFHRCKMKCTIKLLWGMTEGFSINLGPSAPRVWPSITRKDLFKLEVFHPTLLGLIILVIFISTVYAHKQPSLF